MKFISLFFICCLGLVSTTFADNRHVHPQANHASADKSAQKNMAAGYCEIEILNRSYDDVRVYGIYDDGSEMIPFNVYGYGSPYNNSAYIDLFYYGYCHDGMTLYIDKFNGYRIYQGYTRVNTTLKVVPPYLANKLTVEIQPK